jgi:hypothetical protein
LVGEGDGAGFGCGGFGRGFCVVLLRVEDRLDVVGEGLADGGTVVGSFAGGVVGVGWAARPLASTEGAASAPGTFGRIAATVDDPACSELVNVTTVAAATVVITVAAANLYSLVGGTVKLPWNADVGTTTPSTVAGRAPEVTSELAVGRR